MKLIIEMSETEVCDYCQGNGVIAPWDLVLESMLGLRRPSQVLRPCPKCRAVSIAEQLQVAVEKHADELKEIE